MKKPLTFESPPPAYPEEKHIRNTMRNISQEQDNNRINYMAAVMPERHAGFRISLLFAWLAVVSVQIGIHTMWRDEVRALSIALSGDTVFDMFRALHGEGHPAVWYLLLRAFHSVVGRTEVMPVIAFLVGAGAVALLVLRSPFPRLLLLGLVFGNLLSYEYVVMARNYGISVLVMFLLAFAWQTQRGGRFLPGFLLLLLANTNVVGTMMVGAFLLFWLLEIVDAQGLAWNERSRVFAVNAFIAAAGIALCAATILPTVNDAATQDLAMASPVQVAVKALLVPGSTSHSALIHKSVPAIINSLLLFALPLGLIARRSAFVSALAALFVSSLFFAMAAQGMLRHAGVFFFYCVTLYWISWKDITRALSPAADNRIVKVLTKVGIVGSAVLVGLMCARGIYEDGKRIARITPVESRSADLARLIDSRSDLAHATIVADPDFLVEPLPYYIENPTYLLRRQRLGRVAVFGRSGKLDATLGEILELSRELRKNTGAPVIILLTHRLDQIVPDRVYREGYNWSFRASADEITEFTAATKRVARFGPAKTEETFDVYVME